MPTEKNLIELKTRKAIKHKSDLPKLPKNVANQIESADTPKNLIFFIPDRGVVFYDGQFYRVKENLIPILKLACKFKVLELHDLALVFQGPVFTPSIICDVPDMSCSLIHRGYQINFSTKLGPIQSDVLDSTLINWTGIRQQVKFNTISSSLSQFSNKF
ncbi:MAG: hypothetical protein OHK0017_09440 [Patescibacteria group bacterium]